MEIAQRKKSSIPDEIIFEIFSWLPVIFLMRFKCVSKFCNSLISNPYFREIHQSHSVYHRHDKITKFLVFSEEGGEENLYTKELGRTTKGSCFRVEKLDSGSSTKSTYAKGLLCLWNPYSLIQPVIILNPSTRETRILPCLSSVNSGHHRCYCSMGFDSYKRRHKILMTIDYDADINTPTRNWIFTLGDESWREIKSNIKPYIKPIIVGGGVHIDGIIYFFSRYNNNTFCIVAFNVRTEIFRIISSLRCEHVHWGFCYMFYHLIKYEGKIAAVYSKSAHVNVWILQSGPEEDWVHKKLVLEKKRFRINGENIVLLDLLEPSSILLCDLKKNWWRRIDRENDKIIGVYSCDEDSLYTL